MKASRETNRKVIKVPIEGRARIVSTMKEQRFTGRTTRVCHKATGKGGNFLVEMEANAGVPFLGTIKRLPVLEYQGQKLLPQSKIKLQLFPVNEATRIGLEKDGHHPYLELILRPRKKITSVIKHLNDKWGRSSIAFNQPVLFPYKMPDSMSSNRRWTLNDGNISARAVYAAIGSPAVFCLRYGWFSTEPKTADQPSTSANDLQSEGEQRCRSPATENVIDELWKHTALATKNFKSNDASETINADTEKISTGAVDPRVKGHPLMTHAYLFLMPKKLAMHFLLKSSVRWEKMFWGLVEVVDVSTRILVLNYSSSLMQPRLTVLLSFRKTSVVVRNQIQLS